MSTHILVVEDDPNIVDLIRSNLLVRGFQVTVSTTGTDVEKLLASVGPDLVILDLTFPDADGFELCKRIREKSSCGIIVVSARGGEFDKVRALNLGADDYITKPFGIDELTARITATLRRSRPAPLENPEEGTVTVRDVVVDFGAQAVMKGGSLIHLTPTEFAILRELSLHQGSLVRHASLLRRVWGPGYETQTEYLRVYIRRLRTKLGDEEGTLILTEPRAGYRLAPK